jgi:phage portal protein BeeE
MFGWIKAVRNKIATSVTHPRQWDWLNFVLPNTKIDFASHVGDGQGSNVLMAPILWIWRASLEAKMGVLTETKDNAKMDFDHELSKLLRSPNPFYSGPAMMLAIMISWFTDGNVYFLKARDGSGAVRQLWYVPHWMMEPKSKEGDLTDFISYYCYNPGGAANQEILPSEVVHLRHGVDPRNVRKGLATMKILLREIFNDDESANFVAALLLNGGVPGVIISPKEGQGASTGDLQATKEYIKVMFGRSKRGEPLALGAPTEVKEFGYDPNKMNLSVVRNVSEERVCATMGLPAAVVGFGSGMEQTAVGATLMELHRIAWVDCLIPNQDLLAGELTRSLALDFKLKDNQRVSFDRDRVRALQDDRNKEAEYLAKLTTAALMMRSEARKRLHLDVQPEDEVYLMPSGITLEGPGAPEPDPLPEVQLDPATGLPVPAAPPAVPPAKKAIKHRMSRRQTDILRAMDKIKASSEVTLERRMKEFFKDMGKAAAEAYLASSRKSAEDEVAVELVFGSMNVNRLRQEVRGIYGTHYVAVYRQTNKVLGAMGLDVSAVDMNELKLLAKGGSQAGLLDMTTQARDKALKIIQEGRAEGRNSDSIAKDLADAVPAGRFNDSETRARLIARTETHIAQTESSLVAYRSAQGIDQVMIIDGRLGPTDDDCEEANGQVMDFNSAEGMLAAEHPNGTRDIVPVFNV